MGLWDLEQICFIHEPEFLVIKVSNVSLGQRAGFRWTLRAFCLEISEVLCVWPGVFSHLKCESYCREAKLELRTQPKFVR